MKASTILTSAVFATMAAADLTPKQVADVSVLFEDIDSNTMEYISYLLTHPSVNFPTNLISLYTKMMTYTDDSFSTLFKTMAESEYSQISSLETALPWYSTRLYSEIKSAEAAAKR